MKPSIAAVCLLVGAALLPSCKPIVAASTKPQSAARGSTPIRSNDVAVFADYREWTKANPMPARMSDVVAWMCRSLTQDEAAKLRSELKSPHEVAQEWKTFTVFVNDVGKDRLLNQTGGAFPVGTVIVKEKHDGNDASTSELLTVMVKREKGYATEIGDWEFLVLDGFAKAVQKSNAATCISCHRDKSANDYVFADYLPKS